MKRSAFSKQKSAIKPIGQTRRTFLKRSSAAGLAVFGAHTWGADADGWEDKDKVEKKKFKAVIDDILDQVLVKLSVLMELKGISYCTDPLSYPSTREQLRTVLGMMGQQDIEHELKQTISWKERAPGGYSTGTQYKQLSWEYSGNRFLRWDDLARYPVKPGEVWGYFLYMEGYSAEDKLCLGDTENPNECIKGTDRGPEDEDDTNIKSWAGDPGTEEALTPTDYKMTHGTWLSDNCTQPKKVITDSDRVADKFIVKHSTNVVSYDFIFWVPYTDTQGTAQKEEIHIEYAPWGASPWPVEVKRPE